MTTNQSPNGKQASHFHCYLLRSLDPSHPHKTYIGFTTDPKRRLRQHNGDIKNGGARKTRRSGRPWQFVLVVHGFPDQVSALQFEWAWQHPGKSLHVRDAVGDTEAKRLSKKRGTKAALAILKTLLIECDSLCMHHALDIYFMQEKWRDEFSTITTESGRDMPQSTLCNVIPMVEEMPYWKERQRGKRVGKKKPPIVDDDGCSTVKYQIKKVSQWCSLCYQSIVDDEMKCTSCSKGFHELCLELKFEGESDKNASFPQSWTCPACSAANGIHHQKQQSAVELTCEEKSFVHTSSDHITKDYESAREGSMSEDDASDSQIFYRTAPSFDSDNNSAVDYDHGGYFDWDSDDEKCQATSADSSLDEVTIGVLHQSIADTPRGTHNKPISCDSLARLSPELIDLTATPFVLHRTNSRSPPGSIPLIDLSQSPDA